MAGELARLADAIRKSSPQEIPALLGELERLRAVCWMRLLPPPNGLDPPREADRLLTIPEVAGRLGVPPSYAYELARRGELPTVRIGVKYLRVSLAAFQRWLAERQELDTAAPAPHSRRRRG